MKKLIIILFIFTLCVIPCVMTARGQGDVELPGESVYASPEKQKEIAELFDENDLNYLKNRQIWILTESITPVYYVDIWEYVETREWKMYPTGYDKGKYFADKTAGETSVYRAKTTDYDGVFAGDITLYLTVDGVEIVDYDIRQDYSPSFSLVSFADCHMVSGKYIKPEEKKKDYLPYTRYVMFGDLGTAFYVNKEKLNYTEYAEYLVALDMYEKVLTFGQQSNKEANILYFENEMEYVVKYLKSVKGTKEYPSVDNSQMYTCNNGINIINITEYLEDNTNWFYTERDKLIGYTEPAPETDAEYAETALESTTSTDDDLNFDENKMPTVIYGAIAVVLLCAVGCILAFAYKKR